MANNGKMIISKFENILRELRPLIIKQKHDEAIKEYAELYKQKYGTEPSKEQIDRFIEILVAHKKCAEEADEIINDTLNLLEKELNRKQRKHFFINLSINVMVMITCLSYIILSLNYLKIISVNIDGFFSPALMLNTTIVFVLVSYFTFFSFFKEPDG